MGTLRRGSVAALALLTLAACSDDGTTPELLEDVADSNLSADVATLAAQVTIDDVDDMWLGAETLGPIGAPGQGRPGERSRTLSITFLDGGGNDMERYDPLLTATIEAVMDVSASKEGPRWEASVERHRELTLSGLLGDETERTWNGLGTDHVSRMRVDGERLYEMDGATTITDVVVAVPRSVHPWPLSGTISRDVQITVIDRAGERTVERSIVVTFDGTQYATLVIDGEEYVVDLADRFGHRPERRRRG